MKGDGDIIFLQWYRTLTSQNTAIFLEPEVKYQHY